MTSDNSETINISGEITIKTSSNNIVKRNTQVYNAHKMPDGSKSGTIEFKNELQKSIKRNMTDKELNEIFDNNSSVIKPTFASPRQYNNFAYMMLDN